MQKLWIKLFKTVNVIIRHLKSYYYNGVCGFLFYSNGVNVKSFKTLGLPYIHVSLQAKCNIGSNFKMNNGTQYSDAGLNGKCRIEVRDSAVLTIGNNVGLSDATITCHERITLGNNVIVGVGAQIRDTDNHSLNPQDRLNGLDWKNKKTAAIMVNDNVFIGANSMVLKGVTIGRNAIVGAGSVVTKNISDNQIWASNLANNINI